MNIARGARTAIITLTATTALVAGMLPAPATADPVTPTPAAPQVPIGTLIEPDHGDGHEHETPKMGQVGVPVPTEDLYAAAFNDPTPRAAALTATAIENGPSYIPSLDGHVATSCYGDGADGNRVQVLYARPANVPSRYTEVLPVIRDEVRNIDDLVAVSAAKTGGGKRVRWVTDTGCQPTILDLTLPAGTITSDWTTFRQAMIGAGYNAPDRKYLVFADANAICGLGDVYSDDRPYSNYNDGYASGGMFARVDTGCWTNPRTSSAAHEVLHTLGAVQRTAPHATSLGHCTDEADEMCYDDGSGSPMTSVCATESLLDCGNDDYFAVNPTPGSWLDQHWNTANSSFLADAPALPPAPSDATITGPDTATAGVAFTLNASATDAQRVTWTAVNGAVLGTSAALTTTVMGSGTFTYTTRVATGTGRAAVVTKRVTVTQAPAPAGSIAAPASPTSGVAFTATATMTAGLAPYQYTWGENGLCAVTAGQGSATATYLCTLPTGASGGSTVLPLTVTQPDGQSAYLTRPVQITRTAPPASTPSALSVTSTTNSDSTTTLRATLTRGGSALSAAPVAVQHQPFGTTSWTTLTTLTTDANGSVTHKVAPDAYGTYRFTYAGDTQSASVTSGTLSLRKPTLLRMSSSGTAPVTMTATLTDVDGQPVPAATLTVQYQPVGGTTWSTYATVTTRTAGTAVFAAPLAKAGAYRFAYAGTASLSPATSVSAAARITTYVAGSVTGTWPRTTTFTIKNKATGAGVIGASVTLKWRPTTSSTYSTIGTYKTDKYGQIKYSVYPNTPRVVAISFAGTSSYLPTSGVATLTTPSALTMTAKVGRPNTFSTRLTTKGGTALGSRYVYLQRKYYGSTTWTSVVKVKVSSTGYASSKQQPRRKAYYRWYYPGQSGAYTSGYSATKYVTY